MGVVAGAAGGVAADDAVFVAGLATSALVATAGVAADGTAGAALVVACADGTATAAGAIAGDVGDAAGLSSFDLLPSTTGAFRETNRHMKNSTAAITANVVKAATNFVFPRAESRGGGSDDDVPICPVSVNGPPDFFLSASDDGASDGRSERRSFRKSFIVTACDDAGGRSFSRTNRPVGRSVIDGSSTTPRALASAVTASPADA